MSYNNESKEQKMGAGSKSGESWLGIHILVNNNNDVDILMKELPSLAELGINALVVEINYNYAYSSHPELRMKNPISKDYAQDLAKACRKHGIQPIPQFQCLGHQSWAKTTFPLLVQYPQLDETPGQFPDNEGIYCRSWCPQHPDINSIIFDIFDELIDTFEADALHVGMDEVFLIASEFCPRCKGQSPAELFAKATRDYHMYLVGKYGVEMLMWGDRLLDGHATGYGEWEAATNGTHPAIDLIPRDIVICDWHYSQRDEYPSIPLFLEKGFHVWPGGWNEVQATEALIDFAQKHKNDRMIGYLCTTWGAVKPDELAKWPPIQAAMRKLR